MNYYLGITNGPIIDTLTEAGTTAGLWFSSAFFSSLTRRLCLSFLDRYGNNVEILSPHFDESKEKFLGDGVGKYHDRIILKIVSDETRDNINREVSNIILAVKKESITDFPDNYHNDEDGQYFLQNYIQCHYVLLTEEEVSKIEINGNMIFKLSPYLDTLELMQVFPDNDKNNLFYKLLTGKNNQELKNAELFKKIPDDANQLIANSDDSKRIWSIEEIANNHNKNKNDKLKKYKYFAVVQADGDRVGELLKTIKSDDDVKGFSKKCMEYAHYAAETIGNFGGMTIYAGGDDLLFLAPVENASGKTVFELCEDLDKHFGDSMNEGNIAEKKTSLSFGIAIRYNRFPLYEALKAATSLLLGEAKKEPKNNMAIDIQKHSGQVISLKLTVPEYKSLRTHYDEAVKKLGNEDQSTKGNSVIQTLARHNMIIPTLENAVLERIEQREDAREQLLKGWHNFQDNIGQEDVKEYYESIGNLYYDCFLQNGNTIEVLGDVAESDKDKNKNKNIQSLIAYLKLSKFLMEQAGEDE